MKPRRAGVTLVGFLGTLILLAVFSLLSARLFSASMASMQHANQSQTAALRIDNMVKHLREDVWNARELKGAARTVFTANGIEWRSEADGTIIRRAEGVEMKWKPEREKVSFEVKPTGVVLLINDQRLLLESQILLAGGKP